MNWLEVPAAALAWVGRKGTLVVAASLFVGLAVPGLAALCRPWLGEAIVLMLSLAFLRVDPAELRGHFTQPGLIAAASLWTMLVAPALLGLIFLGFGLDRQIPGLYFMLVLQMSAPGLTSSPALAALMGLDVALTLATLILCDRDPATGRRVCSPTFFSYCTRPLTVWLRSEAIFDHRRLAPWRRRSLPGALPGRPSSQLSANASTG